MPSSAITNHVDPQEYQNAVQAGELRVYAAGRGKFEANLTRIKLDQLWMQGARLSLPVVAHTAVVKDRRAILLQLDPDQAQILHSGIEYHPTRSSAARRDRNITTVRQRVTTGARCL